LAAILLLVGYRLANPKIFKQMWGLGALSFFAFLTTVVLTVADDLMVGVFAGVVVKGLGSLFMGATFKDFFKPQYEIKDQGSEAILSFSGSLTFFSAIKLRQILEEVGKFKQIKINLTQIKYIDATSLTIIARETAKLEKKGLLVIIMMPEKHEATYQSLKTH
jgi:anti-anti-sigma factor